MIIDFRPEQLICIYDLPQVILKIRTNILVKRKGLRVEGRFYRKKRGFLVRDSGVTTRITLGGDFLKNKCGGGN